MGFYEKLDEKDFLKRAFSLLENGNYRISADTGLITVDEHIAWNLPWIIIKHPEGMNCRLQHNILFNLYKKDLGQPPIRCQECWKVVVRPNTIVQLFDLMALMEHNFKPMDELYGFKCGIERREYVNGLYGGYFYNKSLDEGKVAYNIVKDVISKELGDDVSVILKRACTEFEQEFGASDKWFISDEQRTNEKTILSLFDPGRAPQPQPNFVKIPIMKSWIRWACMCGDKTYLELVDEPLHAKYVSYHDKEVEFEGAI